MYQADVHVEGESKFKTYYGKTKRRKWICKFEFELRNVKNSPTNTLSGGSENFSLKDVKVGSQLEQGLRVGNESVTDSVFKVSLAMAWSRKNIKSVRFSFNESCLLLSSILQAWQYNDSFVNTITFSEGLALGSNAFSAK